MSAEEARILRERALSFLRNAAKLYEEGEFDLALLNIEQFCQLLVKYHLLVRIGTYPRTHSLVRLLKELSAVMPESGLSEFIDSEILNLTRLEDVHIASRHLPRRYEKKEVEVLLSFSERLKRAIEGG